MPEPQGIALSLSNRRAVLKNDPAYDKLLLALRDEQPEALQDDEIAHLQTLSAPNFRTQNDPVADRARLEPAYQSTMADLLGAERQGPAQVPQMRAPNLRERAWGALESQAESLGPMGRLLGLAGLDPSTWVARAGEESAADEERNKYSSDQNYNDAVLSGQAKGPPLTLGMMPGGPGKNLMGVSISDAELRALKPHIFAPEQVPHGDRAPLILDANGRMVASNRVPTKVLPVPDSGLLMTGLPEVLESPKLTKSMAAHIRDYPQVTEEEARLPAAGVLDRFVDTAKRNVQYLSKKMADAGWFDRSMKWYDGADNISTQIAADVGVHPNQASVVLARLSPTKDWDQNVAMAQRVAKNWKEFSQKDTPFSPEVFGKYASNRVSQLEQKLIDDKITGKTASILRAQLSRRLKEDRLSYQGRPWSALSDDGRAKMMRSYSELSDGTNYNIMTPEGNIAGVAMNKSGEPMKIIWQSYNFINDALQALYENNPARLSELLGDEHKVRAFFNNINRPNYGRLAGERGPSTVDTHQVAASLLEPLGSGSRQVEASMGKVKGGGVSMAPIGISGTNPLYQEALTRASQESMGAVLPRQYQSVGWEGLRGLFSPEQKRNVKLGSRIDAIWQDYRNGRMSLENAQDAIFNEAGGIAAPRWTKSK